MNATQRTIAATLAAVGITLTASDLAAQEVCQDFRVDHDLHRWSQFEGTFTPTPDGLEVRNSGGLDAVLATVPRFGGDIVVMARGSFNNTTSVRHPRNNLLPHLVVVAHLPTNWDGYYGNIKSEGEIRLVKYVGGNRPVQLTGGLDFEFHLDEELALELRAGEIPNPPSAKQGWWKVELRIWRPDDSRADLGRPADPLLQFEDSTPFTSGYSGAGGFMVQGNPLLIHSICITHPEPAPLVFLRGDANVDSTVNIADGVHTLNHIFAGGVDLACADAADSNDDGVVNVSDAVHTLNFVFAGGEPPPAPGPVACGEDVTDDDLPTCETALCP